MPCPPCGFDFSLRLCGDLRFRAAEVEVGFALEGVRQQEHRLLTKQLSREMKTGWLSAGIETMGKADLGVAREVCNGQAASDEEIDVRKYSVEFFHHAVPGTICLNVLDGRHKAVKPEGIDPRTAFRQS